MKQLFLFSVGIFFVFSQAAAQDLTPDNDPIFGSPAAAPVAENPFDGAASRTRSKLPSTEPSTGIVNNPIDGGLSLLLATGALYGVSRIRRAAKSNQ